MNHNNIFEDGGFPRSCDPHTKNLWIRWTNVLDQKKMLSGGSLTGVQVCHLKICAQKYYLVYWKTVWRPLYNVQIHCKVKVMAISKDCFEELKGKRRGWALKIWCWRERGTLSHQQKHEKFLCVTSPSCAVCIDDYKWSVRVTVLYTVVLIWERVSIHVHMWVYVVCLSVHDDCVHMNVYIC